MTHLRTSGLAALLLAAVALPQPAAAGWSICNRTAETMWVAIAYDRGDGGHNSEGWWELNACGGCASMGDFSRSGVWYRAENAGGSRVVDGDDFFCVHDSSAFNIDNQAACGSGSSLDRRGFRFVTLSSRNFTSNINGRASNGKVCID